MRIHICQSDRKRESEGSSRGRIRESRAAAARAGEK